MRGLKFLVIPFLTSTYESHPTRMRGLKSQGSGASKPEFSVASYTDAWIEIRRPISSAVVFGLSHPTRMRGLKFFLFPRKRLAMPASHPTRMRGLKFVRLILLRGLK